MILIVAGVVFLALLATWGIAYATNRGHIPERVTVHGVDIGGATPDQAVTTLESRLGEELKSPVTITAGDQTTTLTPAEAGLSPNWEKTVAQAGTLSANPIALVRAFFDDDTRVVPVVADVDKAALAAAATQAATHLHVDPIEGFVGITHGTVEVTDPADGQNVDPEQLATAVAKAWPGHSDVTVPPTSIPPTIGPDAVKAAADIAHKAAAGDIVATGRGGSGTIAFDRIGEILTFAPEDKKLTPHIDDEAARNILAEGLDATNVPVANAQIQFIDGKKTILPAEDGHTVNWDATMAGFDDRVIGDAPRTWDAVYTDSTPTFTTEQARAATFDDTVSTFTTGGFAASSGVNIRRVAQMVDGAVVNPGEVFSLNGYTGPRGKAQGFVESGVILNGHADTAVGGGISQFATTLYNASYFAGMQDVTHKAHSYYISRYLAGREATVYEGVIDLKFKNTSPYPILIDSHADANSVTVTFKGVKTVQVESTNGGRWAPTNPKVITLSGDKCVPSSGAPGFTTSDTRTIKDLNGKVLDVQKTTTVYDPSPIVKCSG